MVCCCSRTASRPRCPRFFEVGSECLEHLDEGLVAVLEVLCGGGAEDGWSAEGRDHAGAGRLTTGACRVLERALGAAEARLRRGGFQRRSAPPPALEDEEALLRWAEARMARLGGGGPPPGCWRACRSPAAWLRRARLRRAPPRPGLVNAVHILRVRVGERRLARALRGRLLAAAAARHWCGASREGGHPKH